MAQWTEWMVASTGSNPDSDNVFRKNYLGTAICIGKM